MRKFFKKYISTVSVVVLMSTMLLGAASAAPDVQTETEKKPYRIVALGDSLTVGYEPGKSETDLPYGFVDRLQEQALLHGRAETVNVGIAGLKSGGLLNFVKAVKKGEAISADEIQPKLPDPRTPQIGAATAETKADLANADVITITIGGNDLSELVGTASKLSDTDLQTRLGQLFKQYTDSMGVIVADLHQLNPDALIVVADQYQPMPEIADHALYSKLENAADAFTGVIDKMAAGFVGQGIQVKVAHIAKEFVGGEGTMTHMIKDRDIHPNQLGYEAMAKVFSEVIWGGYTKLAAHEAGAPMSVIVKGKELNTPYKPMIRQNLNFVAIKDIVDAIGATSEWDNKTSSTTITYEGHTVDITIGSEIIIVDGEPLSVEAAVFLNKIGNESKTYVPLAALASGLGLDVQYVSKLKTVFINP